ncbi:MAG: iron hydrogenase small subunit [Tissierellales bacterium]|nr:iron hydrogenase small subunit [Tissierellales bacterium]MBN2828162.1 iron hydrogenase small subunit [Tissierellales bacterium]
MINLTINNKKISCENGKTILQAAKENNILIPHLCYLENIHQQGSCRMCIVEVEGEKTLQASCIVPVREGMVIKTNSEKVINTRKVLYELLLSDHEQDCLNCSRNQDCELQALGEWLQVGESRFEGVHSKNLMDEASPSIIRDTAKCILCRRCVTVCNEIQNVGAINPQNRGFKTDIGPPEDLPLNSINCSNCGQCTVVCPVGALQEKDALQPVWRALHNPDIRVIVQTAPAIRGALGEAFGYEAGTLVTGKMVTALRDMGFDDVFDTNFAADLTIIEEGHELLSRVQEAFSGKDVALPMITSCSPGWIKYVEHAFPERLAHLSSCKSPHMMLGALAKTYYAEKINVDPKNIFVVSVMPCTAKKFEITRPEMLYQGLQNVDAVLTTRELAKMIKQAGVNFTSLEDGVFDDPLGLSTGAADIFATSGGVMEAAIRTVYEVITGREIPFEKLQVTPIRGLEEIKTAELTIEEPLEDYSFLAGVTIKVAVTSGLKGAKKLMKEIDRGESPYHFIEIMGCPGGCVNGGGQPRPKDKDTVIKRMEAIWREDEGKPIRKSHENPGITEIYQSYLKHPLGHKSHELLHTVYVARK